MKELGEIIHKAKSGRLIVKINNKQKISEGELVFDSLGKKLGKINELIGPVSSPYASVLLSNEIVNLEYGKIFINENNLKAKKNTNF
ncbi:MAG: H/ACA ribonucleoprotein complex subunit GAR1, partial [Nitrososphaeraceae archaeon]